MNINELLQKLKKRNISLTGRAIAEIWGMDETSFSKKKTAETQIKQKNIIQLEKFLNISLLDKENEISLERDFKQDLNLNLENFGNKIKKIMTKNSLSFSEMAKILNISEQELNNIITGKLFPDVLLLHNIQKNFKLTINWLLYED